MQKDLRKSGIEVIGDVPWGTHLCQFYHSKQDLIEILVPYFKEGLENNEFCMWLTAEPLGIEEAKAALKVKVKDLDGYIRKGQIEILDYSQWYTKTGRFEASKVLEGWLEKENQARERGFDGLRLTGNTFWLEKKDWASFIGYEATVNSAIGKYRMLAVCSYPLDKCRADEVIDVVNSHQFALIKRGSKWETLESSERRKVEDALHESEEKYRTLFNAAPVTISITTPEGKMLKINNVIENMLGYNPEEFATINMNDIYVDPGERRRMIVMLQKDGKVRDFEAEVRRKDGSISFILLNTDWVELGGQRLILSIGRDITAHKKAEEAQARSEEKYRIVIDNTYEWEYWIGPDKRFIYCSPSCKRITGYSPEDFINDPDLLERSIVPEDRSTFLGHYQEVMKHNLPSAVEFRIVRLDGETRWIFHVCQPVFDKAGNYLGTRGSNRDITERKKSEEALRESEERFRRVSLMTSDITYSCTATGGNDYRISWIVGAVNRILGYSIDEVKAKGCWGSLVIEEDAGLFRENVTDLEPGASAYCELRICRKDGTIMWILSSAECASDPKDPARLIIYGAITDITERKKAEERLKKREEYFREITENSSDIIIIVDKEGTITYASPSVEHFLGYKSEEIIGKNGFKFMHPDDMARATIDFGNAVLARGIIIPNVFRVLHRDGTTHILEGVGKNLLDNSSIAGFLINVRDITERKKAEQTLKESKEQLSAIFRNIQEGIILADVETKKFIEANDLILKWLGYDKEELMGLKVSDLHRPEDLAYALDCFERMRRNELELAENVPMRKKDGSVFYADITAAEVKIGDKSYLAGFFRDITEQKKREEGTACDYSVQHTVDLLLKLSLEDVPWNEFLKKSLELILSIPWLSLESKGAIFLVEDDPEVLVMKAQQGLSEYVQKACQGVPFGKCHCGKAALTKRIEFVDRIDTRHEIHCEGMTPHGHYCVPILYSGKVLGVLDTYLHEGFKRNEGIEHFLSMLTNALAGGIAHKKAQEELWKTKDYLQNLLDYVNAPIVAWDPGIRITVFNHAFERLTGRRADEVIGQQLDTLFPNETKSKSMAMIQRALVGERWEEVEIPIRHSDGSVRTVLLNFSTIFAPHSGSSVATIAYGQDITDRRKVEESQRLAQIGQLVAAMAHEVNNPLMIISGNAQLALMEGLKSRELKDELGIIVDQCERAKDIIQRLLKFAKPSKGVVKKISINDCIEAAIKFLEHQYSLSNVKMMRNYTASLPLISIDEKQMQEVFLNLFGNSFDAMPGGGTITITTSRTARNIHIKVADTGTGITEENLKKVATPFFTTKEKGTGLGLAVCHGIVRAHNGEMIYESKLGEGTTVIISLPIEGGGG